MMSGPRGIALVLTGTLGLIACTNDTTSLTASERVSTDSFGLPVRWEGRSPTWDEWVGRQAPLRARLPEYYRPAFLPNMTRWHAADFLPPEYLESPLTDACELPEPQRERFFRRIGAVDLTDAQRLAIYLEYAEQGVVQAMRLIASKYCSRSSYGISRLLSRRAALDWARRSAASGDANAMTALGYCMGNIVSDHRYGELNEDIGAPSEWLQDNSFWVDEELYWHWRAALRLEPGSILHLYVEANGGKYKPSQTGELAIERYKWALLGELSSAFYGESPLGPESHRLLEQRRSEMTEADVTEAERRLTEMLRPHVAAMANLRRPGQCPGAVDFDALNAALAEYGLHVVPTQPWSQTYPLPFAAGQESTTVQRAMP